jgi:3-oxoadipate enol-lactonase
MDLAIKWGGSLMPIVKVGDINLCYNILGEGQPLIAITGFASARNTLFALAHTFAKHYRVVTFDNRGIGKTDIPAGPYSMNMMAGDTIGLLDILGINRANFLGGSMGGMIAQYIAIDHPQKVDKLVLFNTSADSQWLLDLAKAMIPNWNGAFNIPADDYKKLIKEMITRSVNQPFNRLVFGALAGLQLRFGKIDGMVGQLEAMMSHSVIDKLQYIKAPTLVLTGTKDRLIPPHLSEVLASKITGARLVSIDEGSHTMAGEMSIRFNKEVLDFLKSN